ncbi:hypothetical protein [uncultured Clostridium sp.]|nr:hypothetical protein [uncultured Clostridium sp.]
MSLNYRLWKYLFDKKLKFEKDILLAYSLGILTLEEKNDILDITD